ncbi:hypothetical protein EV121DRAFT_215628 [Schizophyllum commune]
MQAPRHVQFALGRNTYHSPPGSFSSSSSSTSSTLSASSSSSTSSSSSSTLSPTPEEASTEQAPKPVVYNVTLPSPIIIQFPAPTPQPSPALTRVAHPLLAWKSRCRQIIYDIRKPPSTASSPTPGVLPRALNEPATLTPCATISIVTPHFPGAMQVYPGAPTTHPFVTVHDVLRTIYEELQRPASRTEYRAWLPTKRLRRQASKAYVRRCRDTDAYGLSLISEREQGLKRVDFLPEFMFQGLEPKSGDQSNVWWLHTC